MARLLLVLLATAVLSGAEAVVFSRCGLANELSARGFLDLPNWVCLVEAESSRDTSAIGPPNSDGSQDFGLFQINNYYWCGMGAPGGDCNVDCYALTDDSIVDDSACAKLIYGRHGFSAWYGWQRECDGQTLPDLSGC